MEDAMKPLARFTAMLTGVVLLLTITPSWGASPVCVAPGCNPTTSDVAANTAGGNYTLTNVSGIQNTAFGFVALQFTTTGSNNTAIGFGALTGNSTGSNNTATGLQALDLNLTGNNNTASGFNALLDNITGNNNTAVGAKALRKSTGSKNIGIGFQAGVTLTTGNNNIYIGNQGAGDESQTIRIGTAQTQTFIAGIANNNSGNAVVVIDTTTGQLGFELIASSARYKRDIAPMGTQSEKVLALRPVTFAYKDEAQGATHYGLVAEEVATVYPELVTRTAAGDVQRVKYQELIPMLLNELQRQQRELAELRALVGSRVGQAASSEGMVASPAIAQGTTDEAVR
jgi:hypothetical protein